MIKEFATKEFITPDWVKNAVFYQIFPDRFAKSERVKKPSNLQAWGSRPTMHGFQGGDLLGVVEHLDYLVDLGINAIYFNPIFQSASNHRYHTHDYMQVDPILGGNAAFHEMVSEAHRHGIRVVLDGVFNHASRGFFQFNHLLECGKDSPYVDWFDVTEFPVNAYSTSGKPNYRCWVGLPALPEFNTKNPQVRQFIFDVARYWLEQGIDGWRLDVPFCIDDDGFWQEFRQVVKSANPEAYLVGEVPWEAQRWLQGDQFDAVMNYQFTQACLGFFGGDKIDRKAEVNMMGLPATRVLDAAGFAQRVEELICLYPKEAALSQLNLLGSHDMPRFLTLLGNDPSALRLAVLFQMTYPGAPCIYYGDEVGVQSEPGNREPEYARTAFPWDKPDTWDHDLLRFYKDLIGLRKWRPALRSGDFKVLYAKEGVIAYLRQHESEKLVVVINNSKASYHLEVPLQGAFHEGTHMHSLTGCGSARVVHDHLTRLALAPMQGAVFAP